MLLENNQYCLKCMVVILLLTTLVTIPEAIHGYQGNSCSLKIDGCAYDVRITKDKTSCYQSQNGDFSNLRNRRSVTPSTNTATNTVQVELHKLRRKMSKLERRLTRSMDDLSSRLLRSVRKIEQHLDIIGNHQKRDLSISKRVSKSLCPKGFFAIYNGDSCYLLSNFNATWYDAKDYCTALNSDLVALGSIREHNLISFLIKNDIAHHDKIGWWTGGTFFPKSNQWMWVSETTLRPFVFIKWAPGQPNNTMSQCVYLDLKSDHAWHDANCNIKYNFVCETMAERI